MIETLVTILHILTCLGLILAILLQSGKGGGVSAAFGGGAGQALGQRGATTVLGRFTGIASATFMITSMILAVYSTSDYRDETLRDIPAAEETNTESSKADTDKGTKPEADKKANAKGASDAKTSAPKANDAPANAKPAVKVEPAQPKPTPAATPAKPADTPAPKPTQP